LSITNNIRKTNNGVVDVSVSFLQTNKSTLNKKFHRTGHTMSLSGVKKNPLTVPCGRFIGVSRKRCSMKKPYPRKENVSQMGIKNVTENKPSSEISWKER